MSDSHQNVPIPDRHKDNPELAHVTIQNWHNTTY